MKRTAALVIAALLAATSAHAAPAPPPANQAEFQARLETFGREIAAFAQPHNAAILRAQELVLVLIDGSDKVLTDFGGGADEKQMQAWSREWAAQVRTEQQALKALQATLPTDSQAIFDRVGVGAGDPRLAPLRRAYARLPGASAGLITAIDAMADELLPLVERAAGGDPEAVLALGHAVVDGTIVMLEAENMMLDIGIAGSSGHPQGAISRASKASNEAVIALLSVQRAALVGETPDVARAAALIRAKSAEALAAAKEAPEAAATARARAAAVPLGPELEAKLDAIYGSYDASSRTEAEIAAILGRTADTLEKGGDVAATVEAEMTTFEGLVEQRVAQQQERIRLLSQ